MKKNVFFAVAIAALAFVGCNKEEHNGQVALNLTGETYVSTEKQALRDNAQLLFTSGDQVYVNGNLSNLDVAAGGRRAILWVAPSETGYAVNYPANAVTVDEDLNVSAYFADHVTLVPATETTNQIVSGVNQIWPMSGYAESAATESFKLWNNVAIISPAVKYGSTWAQGMWGEDGIDPVEGWVLDPYHLPTLTITKVVFSSTNMSLCGSAKLVDNDQPYDIDEDPTEGSYGPRFVGVVTPTSENPSRVECDIVNGGAIATPTTPSTGGVVTLAFGNLAVPCDVTSNKNLTIQYYFQVNINGEVRHYRYQNTIQTNNSFHLKRGARATVIANFYNGTNGGTMLRLD